MSYNAYEQNISSLNEGKTTPDWKWNKNPFLDIKKYLLAPVPSYYDAPMPDSSFVLNGSIGDTFRLLESNNIIDDSTQMVNQYMSLTPGRFSVLGKNKTVFPNQSVRMTVTSSTQILPYKPNNLFPPELAVYSRLNDTVVINNSWLYDPSITDTTRYKIDLESGNWTLKLAVDPVINNSVTIQESQYQAALKNTDGVDLYNVFFLPRFPAVNIIVKDATKSYKYDSFNGIIYLPSVLSISSIYVSYSCVPLLSYVPEISSQNTLILPFSKTINSPYFVSVQSKGQQK